MEFVAGLIVGLLTGATLVILFSVLIVGSNADDCHGE